METRITVWVQWFCDIGVGVVVEVPVGESPVQCWFLIS